MCDRPESLESQIARSCELSEEYKEALLTEAARCGWREPSEEFRDWVYAYNSF